MICADDKVALRSRTSCCKVKALLPQRERGPQLPLPNSERFMPDESIGRF